MFMIKIADARINRESITCYKKSDCVQVTIVFNNGRNAYLYGNADDIMKELDDAMSSARDDIPSCNKFKI